MKNMAILAALLLSTSLAWGAEDTMKRAQALFKPIPAKAPILKGNPASPAKVDLGMKLF